MLNVNPVGFVSNINKFTPVKLHLSKGLTADTFVKTTSFKGGEVEQSNNFISWAQENNFLDGTLQEVLSNPENKLGSGFSHSVYSIPNNDNYVLRMGNYIQNAQLDFSKATLKDTEDKKLNVKIGQKVAEIQVPTVSNFPYTIEVLQKQKGKSLGNPPAEAVYTESGSLREGEAPYEDYGRKVHYAQSISDVAQMPVSSYEKLISDVIKASEAGYSLDHLNSNNLLVDAENNAINLIDMDKSSGKANLGNLLYALTNISYFSTFTSEYDNSPMGKEEIDKAFVDSIQIISKFMEAMKNMGLKLNRDESSYEFIKLFTSAPFTFYCRTFGDSEKWDKLKQMGLAN